VSNDCKAKELTFFFFFLNITVQGNVTILSKLIKISKLVTIFLTLLPTVLSNGLQNGVGEGNNKTRQ